MAGPYFIFNSHSDAPERTKAVMLSHPSRPVDIVEQIASRQELISNKSVLGAITSLYVDCAENKVKPGAGGKSEGAARRLADVLGQFELTFDLYSVSVDNLLTLLPREFNRFRA